MQKFPAELRNRALVKFYGHGNANIKSVDCRCGGDVKVPQERATSGVLIYTPHVKPWLDGEVGPGLCALFGMGGIESLIFCSMLGASLGSKLEEVVTGDHTRLIYAEFVVPSIPCGDKPPATLRFSRSVDLDVMVDVALD